MWDKENVQDKKFVLAYSGGKDSVFAMHKAVAAGMQPVCFIIMTNAANGRSWAHGVPSSVLGQVEAAFGVPLIIVPSSGKGYGDELEKGLAKAKQMGAEYCIFGDLFDIPYEENWNTQRCNAVGVKALYPLMGRNREALLVEFVAAGFKTVINAVNGDILPEDFLGCIITPEVIDRLRHTKADICGENGEYHSFVVDGPLFKNPIQIQWGEVLRTTHDFGNYSFKTML